MVTVFYFSLGTFIGLFPLALAKQTAETIIPKEKEEKQKRNKAIFVIMLMIIISVNIIIMIFSFLRIDVFARL